MHRIRAVAPTLHLQPGRESRWTVVPVSSANARIRRPEARSQQNLFDRSWGYGRIYHPPDGSLPVGLESGSLVRPQLYQNVKSNTVRRGLRHDNPEMTPEVDRGVEEQAGESRGQAVEDIRNEIQVVQGVASPRHDPAMVPTDKLMGV